MILNWAHNSDRDELAAEVQRLKDAVNTLQNQNAELADQVQHKDETIRGLEDRVNTLEEVLQHFRPLINRLRSVTRDYARDNIESD